jgi:hypothetical protein
MQNPAGIIDCIEQCSEHVFCSLQVLLPSQELVTEHITYSTGNTTKDLLAIRTAFAEQWLLGMTDFQVRLGAFPIP